MDMRQDNIEIRDGAKPPRGRGNSYGDEDVPDVKSLKQELKELDGAFGKAKKVNTALNDHIKRVAEKTGMLSSTVRRLVKARHDGKVDEERGKIEQLHMVFQEIGTEATDTH